VLGCNKGVIKLFNLQEGGSNNISLSHYRDIMSVSISPDARRIASKTTKNIDGAGVIVIWDVLKSRIKELDDPKDKAFPTAFSPDGQLLATGWTQNAIKLFDAKSGQLVKVIRGQDQWTILSLAFSRDGKKLAAGYGNGKIRELVAGHDDIDFKKTQ